MSSSASSCTARSIGLERPLKDVMVTAGETATFECELSYEGIAVEWFLGGQKMEASERVSQWSGPPPDMHILNTNCYEMKLAIPAGENSHGRSSPRSHHQRCESVGGRRGQTHRQRLPHSGPSPSQRLDQITEMLKHTFFQLNTPV